ncbi:hypothetical protein GPECTOR_44g4 [Gonium pectorale]|uniref:Uncharacterized protein n=1 Tax=Gonium pectorale TaxID=33097 RepID=A0A150G940_GONPE|nr:hypothetical protein GPECTOR_44g4 [Gonium pectorale]|eukprot:KXZ46362.1 hypothetical protein GPECTOR_44g4 [Gonium pectorale]
MQILNPMLKYEVTKKVLYNRQLHLHLRNKGRERFPNNFDLTGIRGPKPTGEQLHNMVQHDGHLEAALAGSMYGFHAAVHAYNTRSSSPPDHVVLVQRTGRIAEYGIALGSTCPDFYMFYHTADSVTQLQDPHNHVWMYFKTERSDRVFIDVGSLPYGMGMMLNIVPYLPNGTPESQLRDMTPQFGVPAAVLDRNDVAQLDRLLAASSRAGSGAPQGYLADRHRMPVSSMPPDAPPEEAVRALLDQLRQAREPAPPELTLAAPGSPYAGTAAAQRPVRIPFRDDPLDEHVRAAMPFFECAFRNTYAALEQAPLALGPIILSSGVPLQTLPPPPQGACRLYPPSLDNARCAASWLDLGDVARRAAEGEQRALEARMAEARAGGGMVRPGTGTSTGTGTGARARPGTGRPASGRPR